MTGYGEVIARSVRRQGKHLHRSGHLRGKPSTRFLIFCQACGTSFEEASSRNSAGVSCPPSSSSAAVEVSPQGAERPAGLWELAGSCGESCSPSGSRVHRALVAARRRGVISLRAGFSSGWWLPDYLCGGCFVCLAQCCIATEPVAPFQPLWLGLLADVITC